MSTQQIVKGKLEQHIIQIEKHLDSSFEKVCNYIDQILIMDSPISQLKTQKQEIFFPKIDEFHIIGYSEFVSNFVQEIKPLMKQRIQDKDQAQIQSEQNQQSLIKSLQLQELQEKEIKSSSQFSYQLIQDNSFQQFEYCYAISINKDCSFVAAGSDKQIKIFEFKQGMLKIKSNHK
ncbi:unnamed protein product [Paramecium pentaurelia]|uniref:Uncharacterized protein n=1 Tax=Paramecium pentaurelia TaxID=43138 RepID=A0A8S1X894_9CILI|nr:unnamed protein product [Paramecium pentaurelia]